MKVALFAVAGSYSHTNLSIRALRPPLIGAGFDVALIEATLGDTDASLTDALIAENADIYGFSCYIWNIKKMLSAAADLRALRPDAKIIFGGPEVSFDPERFDDCSFVDCIVCGEGERAMTEVCSAFRDGATPPRIVISNESTLTDGILYSPDEPRKKLMYYESSRGCPYSCAYCLSSRARGVKAKSVEQTLSELYEFEKFEGDAVVKLVDRTFNFDNRRANEILRGLLDEKYTKEYHLEVCAPLFDEESFELISKFPEGKLRLEVGLQSTNKKTLALCARHIDPEAVLTACRRIVATSKATLHLDLICGLPGDTLSDIANAFDRAYFACSELQVGFLKLLHGTALRRDAERLGIKHRSEPPYEVLATNELSYEDLRRLHEISDLTERFGSKFSRTLPYLLSLTTPFAFFDGLRQHIEATDGRKIRKIGQSDAFSLLYTYGISLGADEETLSSDLHADFSEHEVRGKFMKRKVK
ncbi:MAG: DUF4080 domain-containing protein [Ruminococcaceae bacterium]|nr:DUF4080 domain-containing protein [Oscillospiraceae bacterium]